MGKLHPKIENGYRKNTSVTFMSNFRPFKVTAINLRWRINFIFDATTNTKSLNEKSIIEQKRPIIENLYLTEPGTYVKFSRGIIMRDQKCLRWKIRWGINFNLTLHGHEIKSKLLIQRNCQKTLNTRHTFWNWLIRWANTKWIRLNLWEIHSVHNSVHTGTDGRTDGHGETSIPHFQLRWRGVAVELGVVGDI